MGKDGTCWAWTELELKRRAPGVVQGEAGIQPFRQGSQQSTQLGFYSHARQKLAKKHHLIKPDKCDCSL